MDVWVWTSEVETVSEIAYDVESVHGCMKVSAVKFRNVLLDICFVSSCLLSIVCLISFVGSVLVSIGLIVCEKGLDEVDMPCTNSCYHVAGSASSVLLSMA